MKMPTNTQPRQAVVSQHARADYRLLDNGRKVGETGDHVFDGFGGFRAEHLDSELSEESRRLEATLTVDRT